MIKFGRNNERARQSWLRARLAAIEPGQRVLDAGAGELRNRALCLHLKYVSQDFCQYEGRGDGLALQTNTWDTSQIDIVSDITTIPEPDASFDVVLCTEVLEHLPNPLEALREFARLLRPGGHMIITAPFCSLTHFAPYHFSTGLSRYWYEHHVVKLGCSVVELTPNGGWFDFVAQELWRLPWIGRTYSNRLLGWSSLMFSLPLLVTMRCMAMIDRGSSELLTFGWQAVIRK
jgi:SAM-dependent methyltransferase